MEFAPWVPAELQDAAQTIVGELDPAEGQMVIDEWAGAMAAESIDRSPLGYLQAMVRRYREGNFGLAFANAVAEVRANPPDDEKGMAVIGAQVLTVLGIFGGKHECRPDYGVKSAPKGGVFELVLRYAVYLYCAQVLNSSAATAAKWQTRHRRIVKPVHRRKPRSIFDIRQYSQCCLTSTLGGVTRAVHPYRHPPVFNASHI
ncbi:MAG: hypothetical protein GY813_15155 [Halieaceae bacterium]|nr:hypothetical protein [Halieaceae bacterium]